MGLNKRQTSHKNRGVTLVAYLTTDENKAVYALYYPFNRGVTSIGNNLILFEEEAKDKEKSNAGTVTKGEMKKSIAKRMGSALSLTKDYAVQAKNEGLKTLVSFSEADINKINNGDLLAFITGIASKVFTTALFADVNFIKYNVTSVQIDAIVTDANTFNGMIGSVQSDKNFSSSANDNLDMIIDNMNLDIESMDNTIVYFNDSNPDFVSGYYKNKVLYSVGVRHEGFEGIVKIGGVPQAGAVVGSDGSKKTVVTDSDGHYEIYLVPGNCKLKVEFEGKELVKDVEVQYRKIVEVDFELT